MYIIEIFDRTGRHWTDLKRFNSLEQGAAILEYVRITREFPAWAVRLVEVQEHQNHPE